MFVKLFEEFTNSSEKHKSFFATNVTNKKIVLEFAEWLDSRPTFVGVDWAIPGSERAVEIKFENGKMVGYREIPPNHSTS